MRKDLVHPVCNEKDNFKVRNKNNKDMAMKEGNDK
jgi:hypothetical protein